MPYHDVANLVTLTKTNMIDEMRCGYGTLRTTGVRIRDQVSRRPAQMSLPLQNLTFLIVKYRSIQNSPASLQVLSGARENALAQSESILQSSRGGWEHLKVCRSTGEGYRSVWEDCVWLPDRITLCWCGCWTLCMLYLVYAVLSVCCTRCMVYLVYGVLGVCCTRYMLYSVYTVLSVCCTRCMLYSLSTHDHGMERYRGITELCVLRWW